MPSSIPTQATPAPYDAIAPPPDPNAAGSQDANGYLYGLGIAPGVHLRASRVFDTAGKWNVGTATTTQIVAAARSDGALINSNSWGSTANGAYTVDCQEYDSLVRDADGDASNGLQPATKAPRARQPSTRLARPRT